MNLSYAQQARRSPMVYLMLAAGLTFAVLALSIDPIRHCTDHPCPAWLRMGALALGGLFALGALAALWCKTSWGISVDTAGRKLEWWNGAHPRLRHVIALDEIAVIRVETRWDTDRIILRRSDGSRIALPDICVPHPYLAWARNLARLYPHIRVETDQPASPAVPPTRS